MNWSEHHSEELLVERYVDGDLTEAEVHAFEARCASDPALAAEIALAREMRDAFRRLPEERLPDAVTSRVLAHARRDARQSLWQDVRTRLRKRLFPPLRVVWQPALAMATLLLAIGIAVETGDPGRQAAADPEVAAALEQVKWTLAFLSDVSLDTAMTVRGSVLEPHVVGPVQGAVEHVFVGPGPTN